LKNFQIINFLKVKNQNIHQNKMSSVNKIIKKSLETFI
jgi:hypothetical protein